MPPAGLIPNRGLYPHRPLFILINPMCILTDPLIPNRGLCPHRPLNSIINRFRPVKTQAEVGIFKTLTVVCVLTDHYSF